VPIVHPENVGEGLDGEFVGESRLPCHGPSRALPGVGDDYFQQRQSAEHYQRQLVRQLERLGHKVTLEPIQAA
jgi:hypothetical protein